jgi:2-phospho-L-lactate/phosphoenolpyruvate guanylyltransferase
VKAVSRPPLRAVEDPLPPAWETVPVRPLPAAPAAWGVVVPVKRLLLAKTRLAAFGDAGRQELALAFALDVVRATLASAVVRRVLVVTDDALAATALAALGADVQADRPDAGLNPALEHGAALLRADDDALGVATVSSDLPALRTRDVTSALRRTRERAFVADAAGSGTTLLAAAGGAALRPAYGPGSAALHRLSGARELPGSPRLRRDVDTPADLVEALALGVGPATRAALASLGPDAIAVVAGARSPGQGTMHL